MNAPRELVRGPLLWATIFVYADECSPQNKSEDPQLNRELWVKWWSENLHSLDQLCGETEFEGSGLGREFDRDGLEEALLCLHKEGSKFELNHETVTRCLHVAHVVCLHCLLFCLRIDLEHKDESEIVMYYTDLANELSRLSDKWNFSGDLWKKVFREWIKYISEEAMTLLYQWTILPLRAVLVKAEHEMDGASGDQLSESDRVSKCSDELCNFLKECRTLFRSEGTDFLYDDMYKFYWRTALLLRMLGHDSRSKELLVELKDMIDNIESFDLIVTTLEKGKIGYCNPDGMTILWRKMELCNYLSVEAEYREKIMEDRKVIENRLASDPDLNEKSTQRKDVEVIDSCDFLGFRGYSQFGYQISKLMSFLCHKRFTEARDYLKQIDLKNKRINADLREFIEGAVSDNRLARFILHSCFESQVTWESARQKQDILLDVCEALGDRLLTAKCLQCFGSMIAVNSACEFHDCIQDPLKLEIRLKEELNLRANLLQPSSSASECVQELISCLRDPCNSDEHKRDNLPDTLRAFRFLKRAIDMYSDLIHNWAERSSNEVEWLILLESQKTAHEMLLSILMICGSFCYKILMKSNDSMISILIPSSVGADGIKYLVPSKQYRTPLGRAFLALSSSSLVWVERGRARTLLNQLGPWYDRMKQRDRNPGSLKQELIEFDNSEEAAVSSVLSCRYACKGMPLFVEYLSQTVINKDSVPLNRNNAMAFMLRTNAEVMEGVMFHCEGDIIEKLVKDFYKTVERQRTDASVVNKLQSILEKLYDILIKPLSIRDMFKDLDSKATVIFVPDKMLYRVPFALLRDKETQKYLFQSHPIAIAPSLRVLQHCKRRLDDLDKAPLKPEGCILAVGNASYDSKLLPGTREELQHLHSSFPGRVKTLEQEEATRARFLELVKEASDSQEQHVFAFIHLGVHGEWKDDKLLHMDYNINEGQKRNNTGSLKFAKPPQRTGESNRPDISSSDSIRTGQSHIRGPGEEPIAKIPSDGESRGSAFGEVGAVTRAEGCSSSAAEDMLPSEDIVKGGFQWRTRLAVLSACDSSRGEAYSDGEVNLPRALMIAGVPAAVVSHWKVSDTASPILMKAFYEHLQCGQDVATALQSAMLQLSSPGSKSADMIFEWGPFLVWGLPTVQLPQMLWTENARKTLPARQLSEVLRSNLNHTAQSKVEVVLLNALKVMDAFLESVTCNACALEEDSAITGAIAATELLLHLISLYHGHLLEMVNDLAEEVYALLLSFEQLNRAQNEPFVTQCWDRLHNLSSEGGFQLGVKPGGFEEFTIVFWRHVMFSQAMKGNHQMALEYANKVIEVIHNAYRFEDRIESLEKNEKFVRRERAVVLRLMGNYADALKEFNDLLAPGEDYWGLFQTSCLTYLMQDEKGALEYAHRARKFELHAKVLDMPLMGAFTLAWKAFPDEYRQWHLSESSSVWSLNTVQLPKEVCLVNASKALLAKHHAEVLISKLDDAVELLTCDWEEIVKESTKARLVIKLNAVNNFLESVSGSIAWEMEKEDTFCTISNIEHVLKLLGPLPLVSKETIALAEEVYALLPLDQLKAFEHQLIQIGLSKQLEFRKRIMYTQAMKASHQVALDYANTMIDAIQNAYECGCDKSQKPVSFKEEQFIKQERAVILRLMGKYDEALREFDDLLTLGESYECLIQTSYLKHLMEDKGGALEYALRAKRHELESGDLQLDAAGYGAFKLGFKALPDEYRQWLLNLDDSTATSSSFVWSLPSVQLPKEQWTEDTRTALEAKRLVVLLKRFFSNCGIHKEANKKFLKWLNAVDTFLVSVYNACAPEEEAIKSVIVAIELLLAFYRGIEEFIALADNVYTLLPLERLERVESETIFTHFWDQLCVFHENINRLNKNETCVTFTTEFRRHIMYTEAMKGNYQTALDYANKMIDVIQKAYERGYVESVIQVLREDEGLLKQERGVILRLMGKYEESLKDFDAVLARGEDYECLIQASYLKHLMEDKSAALEYALRAKQHQSPMLGEPGYGAFRLGFKALPDEYRQWLSNVDESELTKDSRKALAAKQQDMLLLRRKFNRGDGVDCDEKVEALKVEVGTFLTSANDGCAVEEEAVVGAIVATEQLLSFLHDRPHFSQEIIALAEEVYTVLVTVDQSKRIELEVEKWRHEEKLNIFSFRYRVMYTQAMKGNFQIALNYANEMVEVAQNADGRGFEESSVQQYWASLEYLRQERAVILRFMGKYEEALKEFEDVLALREDYECLIQISYLKHLMGDKSEALAYALLAKECEIKFEPSYGAFTLGFKALPDDYRQWLLSVDAGGTSSSFGELSSVQLPNETSLN